MIDYLDLMGTDGQRYRGLLVEVYGEQGQPVGVYFILEPMVTRVLSTLGAVQAQVRPVPVDEALAYVRGGGRFLWVEQDACA